MSQHPATPHVPTPLTGLTAAQVEESRRLHGSNLMTPPARDPWYILFLEKFEDPIIRILMIAAVIAIVVGFIDGHYLEGIGIIMAILLATTLAFLNEYRANQEFDILNKVSDDVPIKVIREGRYIAVPKRDLVVGDLVLIETGDEAPADGTLIEAVSLQLDEAKLTGESHPVNKFPFPAAEAGKYAECAYPPNRVMRGTMVADGHGVVELTAVGDGTEIGQTARAAAEDSKADTPLNRQLERLSKVIGVVGFVVAFATFLALVGRDMVSGELPLSDQQWYFALILGAAVMTALMKVWVPIVGDAFALAGRELQLPEWLEAEGFGPWLKSLGYGVGVFAVAILAAMGAGIVPTSPAAWLPLPAAQEFLKFFMIAVTIIVVAVPEGLAMSVTLSLAYSMRKMTAANNLVRRMHACETIGAATVICSDKTGTLTQNKMQVQAAFFPSLGKGLLAGRLQTDGQQLLAESIGVNSTANLSRQPGKPVVALGNPTEGALLLWLDVQGHDYLPLRTGFTIERQWTFSTERKFMATLGQSGFGGRRVLYFKGAPEQLLARSTMVQTTDGPRPITDERVVIGKELREAQARGMRTLGFAWRDNPSVPADADAHAIGTDLVWQGFVAIADPLRPEVPDAIKACRAAGVQVKVITGDNSDTALEIARQIGLVEPGDPAGVHMTGQDFQKLTPDLAREAAQRLKVLSRARPADKMRMVKLLQEAGNVVAVTGDGTNDAPALNHANVGLAMGQTGTSVAKEASDIILLDDSFPSVVNGIMWGRSLYENIQRFVLFQLTINVVALGIALCGPFIGVKLPLTVIQMLWVNLIMDTFAALALATEPPHWKVMTRPPRNPEEFIVTPVMARSIFGVGGLFFLFLAWYLHVVQADGITVRELSVFFSVFVMLQFWNLFNARCLGLNTSAFKGLRRNRGFLVIAPTIFVVQILIVQFGQEMFRTTPLSLEDWVAIIGGTSLVLWVGELVRWLGRKAEKRAAARR
ncbi:MAG: calcium-translocating P-type ATPase, PMCA-type [Candidatus Riflebacteria bacterium]|nr:calcium-translocating P-type ATPase, PMCA-type [Candidatus Riflebacteria bacterium]